MHGLCCAARRLAVSPVTSETNQGASRDRSVDIETGYGLGGQEVGVPVPAGSRVFSVASRPALGPTQPTIQWVLGALSQGVNRQGGREAEHSPPTSAEVKKIWLYTSTPPYAFMANFTCTFYQPRPAIFTFSLKQKQFQCLSLPLLQLHAPKPRWLLSLTYQDGCSVLQSLS
jgi:hypothetical protein